MELKAGYKQTEVGVIPEDWDVKSIQDFSKIQTGPFGTLLAASEYSEYEGVPLISVGEIGAGRFKVTDHTPRIPANVIRRLPQYVLRFGDIVFGRKGAVDRSAIVTANEDGWFLGSDGISIRPSNKCHPPYLAAQFQRHEVQSWLLHNAVGTTMASLNQGILGNTQIPYPSRPEQQAIAEVLNDADALIESLEQLLAKKRQIKQGAMQELLTGWRRLPGFSGTWTTRLLGDLLTIRHGKSQHEVESTDGDYPILASGGEIGKAIRPLYDKPSVLIGRKGTIDKPRYIGIPFWTVDTLFYSEIHAQNSEKFLFYRFCLINWSQYNEASGVPSLNAKTIESVEITCPDEVEQAAIASALTEMDNEITALETQLQKARQIKQGMMQELLTGRIRLV